MIHLQAYMPPIFDHQRLLIHPLDNCVKLIPRQNHSANKTLQTRQTTLQRQLSKDFEGEKEMSGQQVSGVWFSVDTRWSSARSRNAILVLPSAIITCPFRVVNVVSRWENFTDVGCSEIKFTTGLRKSRTTKTSGCLHGKRKSLDITGITGTK